MPLCFEAVPVKFKTPVAKCEVCGAEEPYPMPFWLDRVGLVYSTEGYWEIGMSNASDVAANFLRWLSSLGWDTQIQEGERRLFCPKCAKK